MNMVRFEDIIIELPEHMWNMDKMTTFDEFIQMDHMTLRNVFMNARVPTSVMDSLREGNREIKYLDALRLAHSARRYIFRRDILEACTLINEERFRSPIGNLCAHASASGPTLQQRLDSVQLQRGLFNDVLITPRRLKVGTKTKIQQAFGTPRRAITERDFIDHQVYLIAQAVEQGKNICPSVYQPRVVRPLRRAA